MTRQEHLLIILAEECAEVAKCATKALRFGLNNAQPGQSLTNAKRIMEEYCDLVAVVRMLLKEGVLPQFQKEPSYALVAAKEAKIEQYLLYSAECGTLEEQ